jgi:hypothetical protein
VVVALKLVFDICNLVSPVELSSISTILVGDVVPTPILLLVTSIVIPLVDPK